MSTTTYCPNCGAPNTTDSFFCASCGTSLSVTEDIKPSLTAPPPPPPPLPPTAPPPPLPTTPATYEQLSLLPDGEPTLNKREARLHRYWQEKRFNELLVAWEKKVADAEINATKGNGLPIALIIIGIIALGGFVGIIILITGVYIYSRRSSARKNLPHYRAVLFYLRDYISKYGIASTTPHA